MPLLWNRGEDVVPRTSFTQCGQISMASCSPPSWTTLAHLIVTWYASSQPPPRPSVARRGRRGENLSQAAKSLNVNPVDWKRIATHTLLVIFSLGHYLVTTNVRSRDVTHVAARNGILVGFVIPHSTHQTIRARCPNNPQASVCVAVRFWQ